MLSGLVLGLCINNAGATISESQKKSNLEETNDTLPSEIIDRPRVEYDAQNLRDPFTGGFLEEEPSVVEDKPDEAVQEQPPSLRVQGVIWGTSLPQAIVNNKVVKIGDNIEGAVVTNINKTGISVSFAGKQYDFASSAKEIVSIKKEGTGIK